MRRLIPTLSLISACCTQLWCAGVATAQQPREEADTVRFTVWGDWSGKELHVKNPRPTRNPGEAYLKLDMLNLGYSAEMPFLRSRPLELFTPLQQDGEIIWQPLITVTIPADIREPLIMFFPNGDTGAKHKIFDLDPATFPFGGYQFVNLTDVRLFAKLDETGVLINPGASSHIEGTGQAPLNVWLRVAAEGENQDALPIYSAMMRNRGDKRMFMFFHNDESQPGNPIAVRTLVDFEPMSDEP